MDIKGQSFNELFINSIFQIKEAGSWTTPRGFNCKEIISPVLTLTDPSRCLCTIIDRKLNYAYVIIEKFMFLSGVSSPEIILAYNSKMKNYLNKKTNNFDGAYGPRVKGQLAFIYQELLKDKDSRRAVVTIHDRSDNNLKTLDSACTLSWQFMIRDKKLIMIVNMRSNDVNWGLCIDVPTFCFIQEVMASWLGLKQGAYIHHPASLHYYQEFEVKLTSYYKFNDEYQMLEFNSPLNDRQVPTWNINYQDTPKALKQFWKGEELARVKLKLLKTDYKVIDEYLEQILNYWKFKNSSCA